MSKSIHCGYRFELPQHVAAVQMSTNMYFYKENQKIILDRHHYTHYTPYKLCLWEGVGGMVY